MGQDGEEKNTTHDLMHWVYDRLCSQNDMVPTGNEKLPWSSIGIVGCTILTDNVMRVVFDDGTEITVMAAKIKGDVTSG